MQPTSIFVAPGQRSSGWIDAFGQAISVSGVSEQIQIGGLTPLERPENFGNHAGKLILVSGSAPELIDSSSHYTPKGLHWLVEASKSLASVAELKRLGASVMDANEFCLNIPGLGPVTYGGDVGAASPPTSAALEALAGPLAIYANVEQDSMHRAVWTPEVFSYLKGELLTGGSPEIDLTGRARTLFHGPYIFLFPGTWSVTIRFEVDADRLEIPLGFEWGHGGAFVEESLLITRSGVYELKMISTWSQMGAAQVRAKINRPLFSGRLNLLKCAVERLGI